MFEE
jgi:hypothetical protein